MTEFKRLIGTGWNTYKSPETGIKYTNKPGMPFTVVDPKDIEWLKKQSKRYAQITPASTIAEKVTEVVESVKKKKKIRGDK